MLFLKQLGQQEKGNLTSAADVATSVDEYARLHKNETPVDEHNSKYANLVNSYYDLATLFYEWGWGTSFHFSYCHPHETFDEATNRHKYYLASKLNLSGALRGLMDAAVGRAPSLDEGRTSLRSSLTVPMEGGAEVREGNNTPTMANVKVLDVGCGIGGPMRNICKFTGADVTGLTLNHY